MNHSSKMIPAVAVLIGIIFFSSCIKEYNYVKLNPGAEVKGCRITTLINGTDTFYVHYNTAGDPTELVLTPGEQPHGWQGDYHFRYDKYHRLTDYFWGDPALTDYRLIWHRYTYHGTSIVTDSLFAYITNGSGPNPPLENFDGLTIDSLDADGRIVKTTEPGNPPFIGIFNYNAKGNLDYSFAVYDNKLNIYHTSRVWMFIWNDYSVNNRLNITPFPVQVTRYNDEGLPFNFQLVANPPGFGSSELFGMDYQELQVLYDCNQAYTGAL
ncbi:MAG TPA: hypothetical protein VGM41_02830, partial [Chitinophagaceae bacterium]